METFQLNKHIQLIINEDNITYLRDDVITEQYKKQLFQYSKLKRATFVAKQTKGIMLLLSLILDGYHAIGEPAKIKLFFTDHKHRYINTGDLNEQEMKILVSKINMSINKWKQSNT